MFVIILWGWVHVLQTLFPKLSEGGRRTHSVPALLLVAGDQRGRRTHSVSALLLVAGDQGGCRTHSVSALLLVK